jgi:hypothetical protein
MSLRAAGEPQGSTAGGAAASAAGEAPAQDAPRAHAAALGLLGGASDEALFAGLLLVAKGGAPAEALGRAAVLRALADGHGARFVRRLLASAKGDMRAVAVAVLGALCDSEAAALAGEAFDKVFGESVPLLEAALVRAESESARQLFEDAVVCLASALRGLSAGARAKARSAASRPSREALAQALALAVAADASLVPAAAPAPALAPAPAPARAPAATSSDAANARLAAVELLLGDELPCSSALAVALARVLGANPAWDGAFGIGALLVRVLAAPGGALWPADERATVATELSRASLAVLQSPSAPREHRVAALRLARDLFDAQGASWPFLPGDGPKNAALLVHVASLEVTVALTTLRYGVLESPLGQLAKQAGSVAHATELAVVCFALLEHCLGALLEEDGAERPAGWTTMPGAQLLQCRAALGEAFASIAQFVCLARKQQQQQQQSDNPAPNALEAACARCLSRWLSANGPDPAVGLAERELAGLGAVTEDAAAAEDAAGAAEELECGGLLTLLYWCSLGGDCAAAALPVAASWVADSEACHAAALCSPCAAQLPVALVATAAAAAEAGAAAAGGTRVPALGPLLDAARLALLLRAAQTARLPEACEDAARRLEAAERHLTLAPSDALLPPALGAELEFFLLQARASALWLVFAAMPGNRAGQEPQAQALRARARTVAALLQRRMADDDSLACPMLAPLISIIAREHPSV